LRAGYAAHARRPRISPAVEAAVWLRLVHRGRSHGAREEVWRFALERAGEAAAGIGGL
jgi:hypothetical protein